MARLINYLILVALSLAMISATVAEITAPEKEESVAECAQRVGSHCEPKVLKSLAIDKNITVSKSCCYKIIQAGYSCYTKLTLDALQNNKNFKDANVTEVVQKSDEIFEKCDNATEPANELYLAKCVAEIGTKCGAEVFNKLIHNNNTVSECCCGKLVDMGLHCHINMAKALILTPALRDVDAVAFLKKSKKLFHQCHHHHE
ncbi:hypothetical protein VNO78_06432 [Psophocarpus tetragonolobus]|uniref:Prolamin-like domain-containing protein n=1 Tax=Psophocarpus tetragonolobus TaxID=3891 RepID=A0AAN9XRL1_PSOTE